MYKLATVLALIVTLLAAPMSAQTIALDDSKAEFIVNLRNAEISVLAEQVSEITQRTLIIDPNLTGSVTVISSKQLTQAGVWSLFQSMLRVRGFVAVESGVVWEIVPETQSVSKGGTTVSYTHLRAHETPEHLVCRLLLEKKKLHVKLRMNV